MNSDARTNQICFFCFSVRVAQTAPYFQVPFYSLENLYLGIFFSGITRVQALGLVFPLLRRMPPKRRHSNLGAVRWEHVAGSFSAWWGRNLGTWSKKRTQWGTNWEGIKYGGWNKIHLKISFRELRNPLLRICLSLELWALHN